MLKQRIITAVVLVVVLLIALLVDAPIFWRLLISGVLLVGFWEWLRFCQITDYIQKIICFALFIVMFGVLQASFVPLIFITFISCLLWVVLLVFTMTTKLELLHNKGIKLSIGLWVLSAAGTMMIQLKLLENGIYWILCFMVTIWAADIGAYFSGRRFGKTKLAPTVSPGKTVEGLVGGILLVLCLFVPIFFTNFVFKVAVLLVFTVGITALISVGGDLFESKLKRHVNLKDSSQVLPGHGGVMDRIDSLLAGAPFFMFGLLVLGYLN